ncbi:hypothetical protein FB466_1375 [Klugiella xanthotipulae]|uniref:Uncharacterized protein n=1 Tax=Klugiella xanthotipulae TaxID=244735 RepID=A0A543HXN4_9MICO|nr:hypothetical protein FB466_1375 [Klugiella xanthotipulae]
MSTKEIDTGAKKEQTCHIRTEDWSPGQPPFSAARYVPQNVNVHTSKINQTDSRPISFLMVPIRHSSVQ